MPFIIFKTDMADNYLETKMEQYRRGACGKSTRRPAGLRVVVAGPDEAAVLRAAAAHASAGHRVAVIAAPAGTPHTVRAYPLSMPAEEALRRILHDWHEVDLLILAGPAPSVADALHRLRMSIPEPLRSPGFRMEQIG